MPCIYDGDYVIPSPYITVSKEFNTTDDGTIIGTVFVISIKGKLSADRGSPNSSGVFSTNGSPPDENIAANARLASIFRKQEALRGLFAAQKEGKKLEFTPWDSTGEMWCNPRIRKAPTFSEGNWFNTCDYEVTMEADILYVNGTASGEDTGDPQNYKVSKATEEWNIEPGDERARTWRLTHSLSAQGKRFYDASGTIQKQAWENAKDYCLNKIGLGINNVMMVATGVLNENTLQAYNHVRTQHISELGGSCQLTETWLCYDPGALPPALEDFTVNSRMADNGITHVTCEGTIQGFEERSTNWFTINKTRYTNATGYFAGVQGSIFGRCQSISGLTLNPLPLSQAVGVNQNNGSITYSAEFDNRAIPYVSGAVSEVVTVQDHNAADVFATIPVLGRPMGPVLQAIGTVTAKKRTIQMEIVMPAARIGVVQFPPTTWPIVVGLLPLGYSVIFMDADEESWVARTGRYTRSTSFTWE